jgi:hypothetical protein
MIRPFPFSVRRASSPLIQFFLAHLIEAHSGFAKTSRLYAPAACLRGFPRAGAGDLSEKPPKLAAPGLFWQRSAKFAGLSRLRPVAISPACFRRHSVDPPQRQS